MLYEVITLWDRDVEHIHNLSRDRENRRYQPGHSFPETLDVTDDLSQAINGVQCVVMVVPSHSYNFV